MKKRILGLILCVTMLLCSAAVFASCSVGNVLQITDSDPKAQTIVLTILKDERTTDAAVAAVQKALSEITEADYNTRIVIKAYTADEYADKILEMSERLEQVQEAYEERFLDKYGNVDLPESERAGDKRKYDLDEKVEYITAANGDTVYYDLEYNKPITVYPVTGEDQLDVIFINSMDLYYQLVRNEYIIGLKNDLTGATAKKFAMKTNAKITDWIRMLGDGKNITNMNMLYAIPNNYYAKGETYILVNKKLYDHYGYSIDCNINGLKTDDSGCDDLADFVDFMNDVAEGNEEMKKTNEDLYVDKVLYNFDELAWTSFFNSDDGSVKSAVMSQARFGYGNESQTDVDSIYQNVLFKRTMNAIYELRTKYNCPPYIGPCFYKATAENNGYAAPAAHMSENEETFAVAVVTGDQSLRQYYNSDDYYVINTAPPMVGNEAFSSMFAISTFSSTAVDSEGLVMRANIDEYLDQENPRCMEIVYALQSDPRVVNLLTYGIRDFNYDIYENENTNMVHNMGKNGYYPIVGKAGNLYLTYPNDQMTEEELYLSADEWKACYNQKLVVSPFCGMRLSNVVEEFQGEDYTSQMAQKAFQEFYAQYRDRILYFDGKDDEGNPCTMLEYIAYVQSQLKNSYAYKYFDGASYQKSKGGFHYTPKADNYRFFLFSCRQTDLDDLLYGNAEED